MAPAQVVEGKDLPSEFRLLTPRGLALTHSTSGSHGLASSGQNASSAMSADLHQRQFVPVSDHRISGDALQMPEQELSSARQAHDAIDGAWEQGLIQEVQRSLASQTGIPDDSVLMDHLTRRFESIVIRTALRHTRGRRIDAASRLGIGRNTITRKIQELKLEDDHW